MELRSILDAIQPFIMQWIHVAGPQFHKCDPKKTSTSWDGDSYSTTAKTLIDLSAVFGIPAGVKMILVRLIARDIGSAGAGSCYFGVSPDNIATSLPGSVRLEGRPNDEANESTFPCPCNSDGDIYYQLVATGSGTLDAWIEIWGYWL